MSCPSKTALTDSEIDQQFGNGTIQGLLTLSPKDSSDREGNGMIKTTALNGIISSLKNSGIIPAPSTSNTDIFITKQKELLKNIQDEYCFYYSRYKYVLEKLLSVIRQGYMNNTADTQSAVQKYLEFTKALNQKLNDLVQIINGVTEDMLKSNTSLEQQIRAFDIKIKDQQEKLMAQNKIIMSNDAVTKLNKQMVKYTEEKGRYTDNLLKMYSVLNIVALGLLVYIYKSAD